MLIDNDLKRLKHNAKKGLAKVLLISKQDMSEKKVLLDAKGKEVKKDPVKQLEQQP